ncbi:Crp/Fnr family transcriptional regulator [Runella sp.]|uniref:Crp/Fnr family transcriptional regulator n=1 Tax=Runella sp. TaxID=1960881 RepID=UPI003D0F76B5
MQSLFNFLEDINRLPEEAKALILAKTKINKYPKGHLLFHQGQVCHYMYFMANGLARIYHCKEDKEVIDWLATSGNPFTAIDSFYSRQPSRYNIELLENSEVYAFLYDDLEELYRNFHAFERIGRLITMDQFLILQERIDMIQFQNAQQRYETFLKRFPNLQNRLQLTHIASYLGISLETLSRIRAKY